MKTKSIKRIVSMLAVAAIMAPTMATLPANAQIRDYLDPDKTYVSEFGSRQELTNAAAAYNIEVAENGFTLLKNKNNALPMAKGSKVTVIGSDAANVALGGGGSGSQSLPTGWEEDSQDLYDALKNAGFDVNPAVKAAYEEAARSNRSAPGKSEDNTYMAASDVTSEGAVEFAGKYYTNKEDGLIKDNMIGEYDDAAIVFLSRSGTEGADANTMQPLPDRNGNPVDYGHEDPTDTYFALEDSEKEMLAYAKKNFDKVIIVVNAPNAMEFHEIENDDAFQSIVWIGQPGWNGILGLSRILNGEVNPSGHTVDIYMADQTKDPTYYNFGTYRQAYQAIGEESTNTTTVPMGHEEGSESPYNTYAIDYAEGIYMGYRYYETVAVDLGADGEEWYAENVTYSFGHGLSYTTFEHEIKEVKGDLSNADGEVTVTVEVKNTGSVAGKDAVQLYVSKPYTAGGIEKAAIDLVSFAKTDIIAAGESETVSMTIAVKDLASFDYDDRNDNDFCGYELEAGNYVLSVRYNSHDVADSETLVASAGLTWDEDGNPDTPNNIYSQPIDSAWGQYNTLAHSWTVGGEDYYLTREELVDDGEAADLAARLTWILDEDNNKFTDEAFNVWGLGNSATSQSSSYLDFDNWVTVGVETDYDNLWIKTAKDVEGWTQGAGEADEKGNYAIHLNDMKGVSLDDPKWVEFMNQLTWEELVAAVSSAGYSNIDVDSINKPYVTDQDGPAQLKGNNGRGWAWVCEVIVASTWDVEIAYRQGQFCGEESMYTVSSGWYGPAMNTHRNPMGGRNFEYFSQDGVQGGMIAAANVKGAVSKGCHVYAKHAFLNDQETSRMNTCTFATEQAIREIYAKPFELSIRDGDCNGLMTSFARIGLASSCSYATAIQLYDNEFGFDGISLTDFYSYGVGNNWTGYAMTRSLCIPLGNTNNAHRIDGTWDADKNVVVCNNATEGTHDSYTNWYWTRMTAQRLFYVVANSNALANGLGDVDMAPGFEATEGEDIGLQHLVDAETRQQLMKIYGSEGYYIYQVSGLPSGLTHIGNGIVSGTPTAAGTYKVYVGFAGNGTMEYLGCRLNMTLVVEDSNVPAPATVSIGQSKAWNGSDYSAKIYAVALGQNVTVSTLAGNPTNADRGKITAYSVAVAAEDVPAGMEFDATTGTLSGRATTAGTYEIPATITYTQVVYQNKQNRLVNYEIEGTVTLTVVEGEIGQIEIIDGIWFIDGVSTNVPVTGPAGADGVHGMPGVDGLPGTDGEDGRGIANVAIVDGALVITYTDGEVVNLGSVIGPQGPAGAAGAAGAQGPAGPAGPAGAAAEGCGSVIAGTAVAAMLAAAAAFVLRKKEN